MKVFLSVIFFILVFSFIPIPFKLKIFFSNDTVIIKLYKFTLLKKSKEKVEPKREEDADVKKAAKKVKRKIDFSFITNMSVKSKIKLISLMKKNRFKPCLYINGYFNYSLADAARTAVSYGVIQTYAPLVTWFLNIVFKIKKFQLPITPIFKDSFIVKSEINCIFTISIAKTIFIVILLFNSIIKVKGDELARENI